MNLLREHSLASSACATAMDGNPAASKKRKAPGSVTLNACTNCKKARSKVSNSFPPFFFVLWPPRVEKPCHDQCDGQKPACKRCITRRIPQPCLYEMHARIAKDHLLAEIERLRTENHHLAQRNRALHEKNGLMQLVVQSSRYGNQSDKIIQRLSGVDDTCSRV